MQQRRSKSSIVVDLLIVVGALLLCAGWFQFCLRGAERSIEATTIQVTR